MLFLPITTSFSKARVILFHPLEIFRTPRIFHAWKKNIPCLENAILRGTGMAGEGQGRTARGWEAQAGEMGFVKPKKIEIQSPVPWEEQPHAHQGRVCGLTAWKALLQQRSQGSWGTPNSPGTRNLGIEEEIMESIAQNCSKPHPVVFNS